MQTLTATVGTAARSDGVGRGSAADDRRSSLKAAAAAAAAGRAAPPKPPANEPLPAIIGGRVDCRNAGADPVAAARRRRGSRAARRHPGDLEEVSRAGRREDRQRDDHLENGGDAKKFVEAKTTATFSAPGTYWLRAQVNDSSGNGGGGDQCCWTTAHVVVNVK